MLIESIHKYIDSNNQTNAARGEAMHFSVLGRDYDCVPQDDSAPNSLPSHATCYNAYATGAGPLTSASYLTPSEALYVPKRQRIDHIYETPEAVYQYYDSIHPSTGRRSDVEAAGSSGTSAHPTFSAEIEH